MTMKLKVDTVVANNKDPIRYELVLSLLAAKELVELTVREQSPEILNLSRRIAQATVRNREFEDVFSHMTSTRIKRALGYLSIDDPEKRRAKLEADLGAVVRKMTLNPKVKKLDISLVSSVRGGKPEPLVKKYLKGQPRLLQLFVLGVIRVGHHDLVTTSSTQTLEDSDLVKLAVYQMVNAVIEKGGDNLIKEVTNLLSALTKSDYYKTLPRGTRNSVTNVYKAMTGNRENLSRELEASLGKQVRAELVRDSELKDFNRELKRSMDKKSSTPTVSSVIRGLNSTILRIILTGTIALGKK